MLEASITTSHIKMRKVDVLTQLDMHVSELSQHGVCCCHSCKDAIQRQSGLAVH